MKVATYNVNGINGRLPNLLEWLEARPDVVCLQELKSSQARFPAAAIEQAGYGAIWQGDEIRRSLPGDRKDTQSRYLEAAVEGIDRMPLSP